MIYLDQTCSTPAANLALDEWLLDQVEHEGGAWLRTWQPCEEFVVLGRGNRAESEVNLAECKREGIPVFRRSSGGGTVLLGPGCLCYSIVMPIESEAALASPRGTNEWMLRRLGRAIGSSLETAGDSDLVLADRKVAGHAQRRKRHALLFHGSLLLEFDLDRIDRFLLYPSRSPNYRGRRGHGEFLANLGLPAARVARCLAREWQAEAAPASIDEPWFEALLPERLENPNIT